MIDHRARTDRQQYLGRSLLDLVLGVVAVALPVIVVQSASHQLRGAIPLGLYYLWYATSSVLVAILAYRGYVRYVERRVPSEIARSGALWEIARGTGIGLWMAGLVIAILWLLGVYRTSEVAVGIGLLALFANDVAGAVVEEFLLRAVVFRITEGVVGTWWAIGLSSVLFGALHAGQPRGIPVALAAGALLAASYALTRQLWVPIGIHFGWDYALDGVFGLAEKGQGLVSGQLSGAALLSGGAAGVEGSLVAFVVVLGVVLAFLARLYRRGRVLPPEPHDLEPRQAVSGIT